MCIKYCKICGNEFNAQKKKYNCCSVRCARISLKNKVYGRGINDVDFPIKVNGEHINSYKVWRGMFNRCYAKNDLPHIKAYSDVTVCTDWWRFSKFLEFYNSHYIEGYVLDKDICRSTKNRMYCPENCAFIPKNINNLFRASRVHFIDKKPDKNGMYDARLNIWGNDCTIGKYKTINEAFLVYKKAKEDYIKEVAEFYFGKGLIEERVYNALIKYEVNIND